MGSLVATLFVFHAALTAGVEFHVAMKGDVANAGTEAAPFATLDQARDAIRALKASDPAAAAGATVWVHAGAYSHDQSFVLTPEDSGTADAPIVYRAVQPATVRLYGGTELPSDAFSAVSDAAVRERIPEEARAHVQVLDLQAMGVTEYGAFPDGFEYPPALPELFFNDAPMDLARWPNEGWAEIDTIVESGPAPWRNHASDGIGTFTYKEDNPSRWATANAVYLEGYWCFDWACETVRVQSIDPAQKQIVLGKQHHYGLGSGNPAPRRYRAINLLEELDVAGEYYLDRELGLLYFYPPGPLDAARVVLSRLTAPVVDLDGASFITLRGFIVEATAGTGVRVTGGEGVELAGCTFRNTGLEGAIVSDGLRHRVQSCDIYDTGTGGLHIGGGDRKTLTACEHEAFNNDIHDISRRMRTHAYNLHVSGVGVRMAHNHIHNAPHQAIGLAGNDHLLEYNEINHIAMESDDCGAFYMGRNPSDRGTMIRYNYWHDIGSAMAHGSCAVYFDDGDGGQTVFGNVFYRASGGNFGAVFMHGGHDNWITNNIFIECKRAMGHAPWSNAMWNQWLNEPLWQERLLKEVDITKPPYTDKYPELTGFMHPGPALRLNHAERNIAYKCGELVSGNWDLRDCLNLREDPGFVDAANQNFALRDDAPVFKALPDFQPIPFGEIGLVNDEYRSDGR